MIKVKSNIASRESIPLNLLGLLPESLLDLSWTPPELGLQDCAWWPEVLQNTPLGEYERYGNEILTVDTENKCVIVSHEILPWTQEEIDAYESRPIRITKLAFRNRFTSAEKVAIDIAAIDNPNSTIQERQQSATIRVIIADCDAATFIDINRPDTRAGVQYLESIGVIAVGRSAEILSISVSPVEQYNL